MSGSRRCVVAVPGSSEKMIGKALDFRVDQIFLDLEDAVAPTAKAQAREIIAQTFASLKKEKRSFAAGIVSIRVNGSATPWLAQDLDFLSHGTGKDISTIIYPKSSTLDEMKWLDAQLSQVEKSCGITQGSIGVDAQIESAQGLINVEEIAKAPRLNSLAFGPVDFMADLGASSEKVHQSDGHEGADIFHYPLMKILVAARAAGIFALDGPVLDVHNLERFKASAMRASAMGFDGKWVVHPSQIEACNDIFTPSQKVFDSVSLLLQAYEYHTSSAGGAQGAVIYEGAMIDEASRKMALATYARGISAGLKPGKQFKP